MRDRSKERRPRDAGKGCRRPVDHSRSFSFQCKGFGEAVNEFDRARRAKTAAGAAGKDCNAENAGRAGRRPGGLPWEARFP
jgi:hypothetical protein